MKLSTSTRGHRIGDERVTSHDGRRWIVTAVGDGELTFAPMTWWRRLIRWPRSLWTKFRMHTGWFL